MGDKDDYLTCYRVFFERFAATVYVDDQLPVNIGGYTITEFELPGEVIYWTTQYLTEKQCPPTLMTPLQRIILDEVRAAAEKHPKEFGFHTDESAFIALRLMQAVIARVNAVCLRYLDNSQLDSLPPPALLPRDTRTVALATKNIRRVMEDRHVVIGNLEALFGIEATEPTSFYAVYDGHAGSAAATYCAAHLHQYLVESRDFQTDLQRAVREAFLRTDAQFVRKSNHKRMCGGSTAVAVVVRGRLLLAAWAGDSLALLAKRMRLMQLVHPHKPDREDERLRIESSGGTVIHYGTWRVNGQLAVSRAIGDAKYKPYVTARPEFTLVELDGDEDFVVLASDGLWDFVNEDMVAHSIYTQVAANPDDLEAVTRRLIAQAKEEGSLDNISVVVVFLKDPRDIVAETYPPMDLGLDNALSNAPRFGTDSADGRKPDAVPMGIDDCEADAEADNGISDSDSEDFGPETAVDADDVDDADADLHHHEPAPPTPPAHAVEEGHVDGVLVDNVAESGEDSEDEWNYYKGEGEPEPDEQNPSEEADDPPRSDTPCQDNSAWESSSVDMNSSPLNPDAPVFVPGGVAGSDVLLAESPRKPLPMDDIELPDVAQFQTEAVIRPAELVNLDNSDHLNGHHNISMDGATEHINGNGKCDMDSLGFGFNVNVESDKIKDTSLIQEFERIQKDTTDYCDVQIFQAHETNPFDDGDDELFERLKNKERDPMSMSFYQEKDDDTCERFTKIEGHIDLNAVQPLPDSDDEDIQPNGAYDTPIQNDKENVPPEQKNSLLDQEDIQEPNNDILKFEDRADNVVGNITNLDNSMDYNIDNTNNMQSYSNVEFECTNIPQDVLQTDTPESHKLLFEQIPEIPDGKSSELGFTNDDLQDRSESDKDIRVITPEDEISQDIESKFDESPIADSQTDYIEADIKDDLEQEKEIELESDTQSKEINEATVEATDDLDHSETINEPVLSLESAIIDQTQAVMHHIPSEKEQVQSINFEDNVQNLDDISEIKDNVILDKMDNIEDNEDDMKDSGDVKETPEVELVSVDDQDNIVPKSTLPSASPVPSPLPSESPLPILKEIPSSPILETKSPIPTDETVEFESRSPLPSQSPIPADSVIIQTSPVPQDIVTLSPIPAEVPLPRESPVPSESPVPQEMQCVEDDLPCESSMPSDLHVQVDTPLLVESPLPVESHVPDALLCDAALSVKPDSCVVSPLPTDNSMVSDSSLPKEAIIEKEIVTNYATVLSESPLPTDKALMEETIIADNLVPTETLAANKDTLISESPLPTELSQPRESPLPTDELIPKSPLLVEPSSPQTSPLPTESIISETTLPIDDVQVVESPLPQELLPEHKSPIPEELSQPIEPIQLNETTSLTEAQLEPELHSQINEVQSVESLPQLENTSPVQSHDVSEYPTETINIAESPNVSISPAPVVASPAPSPSPAPVETITEDVRHLDMKDTVADFVCELRLTPPVTQDTVEEPVKLDSVAHSEAMLLEASSGPTPDIVPDERVDLPITRNELVTDIDIGIPESRAQEICVPVTSEIQQDDAMEPAVGTPPPTPAVKSLQMVPATLDIPPLSETPMAGDAGALAAAAAVTAGAAAITAATATTKAKTPATKKSPTTPTAKTPKTVPKSTPTPRTPASAAKKTAPASPAAKTPAASKPAVARTSLSAKSTPATKPASKPTTPLSKTLTPVSKPTTKPSPAPVKEAPAVAKAAPARTATARLPAKPTSAKPATTASKTSTAAAKPSAPRPTPRPAAARPATTTTAAPTAAKPKDIKPKTTTPKALANGDVKSAAKPAPKPALTARLPAAKPAPKPAPRSTAAPPASNVAPAKAAAPRMAAKAPLDKQSKDLANKRITAKAAPPRTAPAKAPTSAKSAAAKTGPKKVELPKKDEVRQNGLANGSAPIKPPPSPPPADNALLPDVIA